MKVSGKLSKSAEKIQQALNKANVELKVIEFAESTRTAEDAANTIGCSVSQIAKSLIFRGKASNKPILIVASGTNRVNEKKLKEYLGENLSKPNADFVLEHTGFSIGGVPPIGHINSIQTFIDKDLMLYEEIWAAAGTPNAVFKLNPEILQKITSGIIIDIK